MQIVVDLHIPIYTAGESKVQQIDKYFTPEFFSCI
jgi:hypothetical protein